MNKFVIQSNEYLDRNIQAFYHSDYQGGDQEQRDTVGTIEFVICKLKNQFKTELPKTLQSAYEHLIGFLELDLPQILKETGKKSLTVCMISRAKAENTYSLNQKMFRRAVSEVATKLNGYIDGTTYIIRHTNTATTHLKRSGHAGDGEMPYPGITKDTCTISGDVRGKDILLIDDLYTKTVNIDEDAIQALLDNGANSVTFYSVGKTASKF